MKLIHLYDETTNTYLVDFPTGFYNIDGKKVNVDKITRIQVENIDSIWKYKDVSIVSNYIENKTGKEITTDNYLKECLKLEVAYNKSPNLDTTYELEKFKISYTPVRVNLQVPDIKIECYETPVKLSTGNPFITSSYLLGQSHPSIYIFDKPAASRAIAKKILTSFGLQESSEDYRIESKSFSFKHDKISFGGKYGIFEFYRFTTQGNYETVLDEYNKLESKLKDLLTQVYKESFGTFDNDTAKLKAIIANLDNAVNKLKQVTPFAKHSRMFNDSLASLLILKIELISLLATPDGKESKEDSQSS